MDIVFVNGQVQDTVSALDRGLLYGDNLFETVAIVEQEPLMLDAHFNRLNAGAEILGFEIDQNSLEQQIDTSLEHCKPQGKTVLRITITRGEQSRGYQPNTNSRKTIILSFHKWPKYPEHFHNKGMKLGQSHIQYAQQPHLAGIKHGNRLEQVLAAQSIRENFDDVLMLDIEDNVISTSKGNIFIQFGREWFTPDLSQCGIDGIVRASLIQHFKKLRISCKIESIKQADLLSNMQNITTALCCNSIMGIVPISQIFSQTINSRQNCQSLRDTLIQDQVIAA